MTLFTEAQCEAALRKHAGLVALAAQELGTSRQGLHARIERSKRLQKVRVEIEETSLDLAEGVILDAIRKKDKATARWYAERKGKARGYVTKSEVEGRLSEDQIMTLVEALAVDPEALQRLRDMISG